MTKNLWARVRPVLHNLKHLVATRNPSIDDWVTNSVAIFFGALPQSDAPGNFGAGLAEAAWNVVQSGASRRNISHTFGAEAGAKVLNLIQFIARPFLAQRVLEECSIRFPGFRALEFLVLATGRNGLLGLEPYHRISILDAWYELGLPMLDGNMRQFVGQFEGWFAGKYDLRDKMHAELEILLHYKTQLNSRPYIRYLGSSHKPCSICEATLFANDAYVIRRGDAERLRSPPWYVDRRFDGKFPNEFDRLCEGLTRGIRALLEYKFSYPPSMPQPQPYYGFGQGYIQ